MKNVAIWSIKSSILLFLLDNCVSFGTTRAVSWSRSGLLTWCGHVWFRLKWFRFFYFSWKYTRMTSENETATYTKTYTGTSARHKARHLCHQPAAKSRVEFSLKKKGRIAILKPFPWASTVFESRFWHNRPNFSELVKIPNGFQVQGLLFRDLPLVYVPQ